ncbi:toxin-antitoxin system HicB family antitoxin [Desulfofundulus kuznetsovii]|uniref:toxin-antitoxin system HicB family antitoxin n=1 Tax=Desulfofundulus kuznetsovii TaxID=58135 RepID=UPI0003141FFC
MVISFCVKFNHLHKTFYVLSYSGRILVRAPKSLHRILAEKAREEGVSLNQYIVYQLSRAVSKTSETNRGIITSPHCGTTQER